MHICNCQRKEFYFNEINNRENAIAQIQEEKKKLQKQVKVLQKQLFCTRQGLIRTQEEQYIKERQYERIIYLQRTSILQVQTKLKNAKQQLQTVYCQKKQFKHNLKVKSVQNNNKSICHKTIKKQMNCKMIEILNDLKQQVLQNANIIQSSIPIEPIQLPSKRTQSRNVIVTNIIEQQIKPEQLKHQIQIDHKQMNEQIQQIKKQFQIQLESNEELTEKYNILKQQHRLLAEAHLQLLKQYSIKAQKNAKSFLQANTQTGNYQNHIELRQKISKLNEKQRLYNKFIIWLIQLWEKHRQHIQYYQLGEKIIFQLLKNNKFKKKSKFKIAVKAIIFIQKLIKLSTKNKNKLKIVDEKQTNFHQFFHKFLKTVTKQLDLININKLNFTKSLQFEYYKNKNTKKTFFQLFGRGLFQMQTTLLNEMNRLLAKSDNIQKC